VFRRNPGVTGSIPVGPARVSAITPWGDGNLTRDPRKRSRSEALADFGREGGIREKQRWAQYWRDVEKQIPLLAREKIMKTAMVLQGKVERGRLQERRAREYHHDLLRLGVQTMGQMDNLDLVATVLVKIANSPRHLATLATAYNYYRNANHIEKELDITIDRRCSLPDLPPENTLQACISTARRPWWQAYFRLLYEAGPRPSEPFALLKRDVNFTEELIRLGTEKGSGETLQRELRISPLLVEQLRLLTANKNPEDYIFIKPLVHPAKPLEYDDAQRCMTKIRAQVKDVGFNVDGLVLYSFRHAFATRLFHATKELPLVMRAMGHRSIETTMLYIHLLPNQPKRFDVARLELIDKEGIAKQIAEGWELAVQTPMEIYFKRPRWVP